jgi:hypothetical protein
MPTVFCGHVRPICDLTTGIDTRNTLVVSKLVRQLFADECVLTVTGAC